MLCQLPLKSEVTSCEYLKRAQKNNNNKEKEEVKDLDVLLTLDSVALSLLEAKRSQSISNCAHLSEALPATKSVPLLLHTVSALFPGFSYSSCSHRLSGTVILCLLSCCVPGLLPLARSPLGLPSFVNIPASRMCAWPLHLAFIFKEYQLFLGG